MIIYILADNGYKLQYVFKLKSVHKRLHLKDIKLLPLGVIACVSRLALISIALFSFELTELSKDYFFELLRHANFAKRVLSFIINVCKIYYLRLQI